MAFFTVALLLNTVACKERDFNATLQDLLESTEPKRAKSSGQEPSSAGHSVLAGRPDSKRAAAAETAGFKVVASPARALPVFHWAMNSQAISDPVEYLKSRMNPQNFLPQGADMPLGQALYGGFKPFVSRPAQVSALVVVNLLPSQEVWRVVCRTRNTGRTPLEEVGALRDHPWQVLLWDCPGWHAPPVGTGAGTGPGSDLAGQATAPLSIVARGNFSSLFELHTVEVIEARASDFFESIAVGRVLQEPLTQTLPQTVNQTMTQTLVRALRATVSVALPLTEALLTASEKDPSILPAALAWLPESRANPGNIAGAIAGEPTPAAVALWLKSDSTLARTLKEAGVELGGDPLAVALRVQAHLQKNHPQWLRQFALFQADVQLLKVNLEKLEGLGQWEIPVQVP